MLLGLKLLDQANLILFQVGEMASKLNVMNVLLKAIVNMGSFARIIRI